MSGVSSLLGFFSVVVVVVLLWLLPFLVLSRNVVINVKGIGCLVKGVDGGEFFVVMVGPQKACRNLETLVILNALVDNVAPDQRQVVVVVKDGKRQERLGIGRIGLVILQIGQEEMRRILKLRHQHKEPILSKDGLHKKRTNGGQPHNMH